MATSAQRARFTRKLHNGCVGPDVEGVGRALSRAHFMGPLAAFAQKPARVRRTWGTGKTAAVRRLQAKASLPVTGIYGPKEHAVLERLGAFDRYAQKLMLDYRPEPTLVFPFPLDAEVTICQGLHETGGLPGNWAIDFCCAPGTAILAPERATVSRLSGHSPDDDTADSQGVFGWTTYLLTPQGRVCFITHQGSRSRGIKPGVRVEPGDLLGRVGDQRFRPDHAHIGYSSPKGPADAKAHITAVSRAPRIH